MKRISGRAAARCAAAAIEMPVFQRCGTTGRPRSAAISHTRSASLSPPTRPMSGCATPILP